MRTRTTSIILHADHYASVLQLVLYNVRSITGERTSVDMLDSLNTRQKLRNMVKSEDSRGQGIPDIAITPHFDVEMNNRDDVVIWVSGTQTPPSRSIKDGEPSI